MSDRSQRTESPTPRRLEKARQQGQFPVSRDFAMAVQFAVFVLLAGSYGGAASQALFRYVRGMLHEAFTTARGGLGAHDCQRWLEAATAAVAFPLLAAGAGLVASGAGAHLAVTRLGLAPKNLAPDFGKLSPLRRLRELRRHNWPQFVQALVLAPLFGWLVYALVRDRATELLALPLESLGSAVRTVAGTIDGLLWKTTGILLAWGVFDLYRQKRRFLQDMKMTKQEIRDEAKESEGNPQVKSRLRRLQRDLLRRRMMRQVATATAVVVNPTHYAVALRYQVETMAAPLVVAKGKNWLALRIRQRAIENQVPIIENAPLAQALYKSADVGQEIPAALYRAVAEILAYIFHLRRGLRPNSGGDRRR